MQITFTKNGEEKNIRLKDAESVLNINVLKDIEASIILDITSDVKSANIKIDLDVGAKLNILCLHVGGKNQKIIQKNNIKAGATLYCQSVSLSCGIEHKIISDIDGESASSSIDFISYAKGNEKQNIFVKNIFKSGLSKPSPRRCPGILTPVIP